MTNVLNEEIQAIKNTLVWLNKGMILEHDNHKREKMKRDIKELNDLLITKLNQYGDG